MILLELQLLFGPPWDLEVSIYTPIDSLLEALRRSSAGPYKRPKRLRSDEEACTKG